MISSAAEARYNIGRVVVVHREDEGEAPRYLTLVNVLKTTSPGQEKKVLYLLACDKHIKDSAPSRSPLMINVRGKVYIFFTPKENTFRISTLKGPEVKLFTPFDEAEEKDKELQRVRKSLMKFWFRDVAKERTNEAGREDAPRRLSHKY